jgi:HEAT repeat protein
VWLFRRLLGETPPPEPRDRAAYARALGRIGGSESEDLLLFMAEDANEEVRFDVAESLGMLKSTRALPQLIRSLDDAIAFQKPGPPSADATLYDQYEGRTGPAEWRQVREAAVASIEGIQGEKKSGTLEERAAAWRAWWATRPGGR